MKKRLILIICCLFFIHNFTFAETKTSDFFLRLHSDKELTDEYQKLGSKVIKNAEIIIILSKEFKAEEDLAIIEEILNKAEAENRLDSTIDKFEEVSIKQPEALNILFTLSYFYDRKGLIENEYEVLNRMEDIAKNNPKIVFNLALVYGRKEYLESTYDIKTLGLTNGSIIVQTTPGGASIYLNNDYIKKSPCVLRLIEEGTYEVKISLKGYMDSYQNTMVKAGEETLLKVELMEKGKGFIKLFGGSKEDWISEIIQTRDGGYIAVGYSSSTNISGLTPKGGTDGYLIKLSANGSVQWQKSYGGSRGDYTNSICEVSGGGYLIAGGSDSANIPGANTNGGNDCYIIRTDASGKVLWQKYIGGFDFDSAYNVCNTLDGGFIFLGYSRSKKIPGQDYQADKDFYVVKLNSNGEIQWQKMYGGSNDEVGRVVIQTSDENYILIGRSMSDDIDGVTSKGKTDGFVIKIDKSGNIIWQKLYGGTLYDYLNDGIQTPDGGFIFLGESSSTNISGTNHSGSVDFYVLKTDSQGNIKWQKMYGRENGDSGWGIASAGSNTYVLVGTRDLAMRTNDYDGDGWVIKINSSGNVLWERAYGGSWFDGLSGIIRTKDDEFLLEGITRSDDIPGTRHNGDLDYMIVKIDMNGNY